MRALRKYDGEQLIFDAAKSVLDKRAGKNRVLIKMVQGPLSYTTPEDITFYRDHPYQWVSEGEGARLRALQGPVEFASSNYEDCHEFYAA